MPPLAKINTRALVELAEELRYAPRSALLRDIERAEALAAEIDQGVRYPADWVVFRVTGYRPEMKDPDVLAGGELLADLSALVERLCDASGLRPGELEGGVVPADALAARWSVSRKTLGRYRRQGLIGRREHDEDGSTRLVFSESAAAAFEAARGDRLARAAGFARIDDETAARMVGLARRYRARLGWSKTQVVERLAARFGRSKEGVRQVLLRHDEASAGRGDPPVFEARRVLDDRARRVIERAWRRGIEPGELVKRYGRTRAGIHAIVNEQRLARLGGLGLGHIAQAALSLDEQGLAEVLGAAPVAGAAAPPLPADMVGLIALMRERVVPVGVEERTWAQAEQGLRARAARLIASMHASGPEARLLDRAETDLRWAATLRAALGRTQLHLVLETLESTLGVALDAMRGADARVVVSTGLVGLREGIDAFDPWKRGRLAAPVGLMVSRVRPEAPAQAAGSGRARVRMQEGTAAVDWAGAVSPWARAVRPDGRLAAARGLIDEDLAAVLTARFGFDAARPRTLEEIAGDRGVTVMQAGRLERRAVRAGLKASRGG